MLKYLYSLLLIASLASSFVARGQQSQPQQQQLDALDKYAKEVEARGGQPLSEAVHNVAKAVYETENFIWDSGSEKLIHRGGTKLRLP
jgi:hypothetical protein